MADLQEGTSPAQAAALVAAARSTRLTGRAAVLAVVICAIALSLAYPVREYIAQRQQIDQLLAQQQTLSAQVQALQQQDAKLTQTWYIEQQARAQLRGSLRAAAAAAGQRQAVGVRPLVRQGAAVGQAGGRQARQMTQPTHMTQQSR
jgi:cell division protein FtsB